MQAIWSCCWALLPKGMVGSTMARAPRSGGDLGGSQGKPLGLDGVGAIGQVLVVRLGCAPGQDGQVRPAPAELAMGGVHQ